MNNLFSFAGVKLNLCILLLLFWCGLEGERLLHERCLDLCGSHLLLFIIEDTLSVCLTQRSPWKKKVFLYINYITPPLCP